MKRVILYIWSIAICIGCTEQLGYESIGELLENHTKEYFIYTTSDNQKIDVGTNFDATIINHIYQDGVGIIQFDKPVTSIGDYAFNYCSSLTSITIPDSVTSIGSSAFYGCRSLKAFYGKFASSDNRCLIFDGVLNSFAPAGLTQYTIPDSVTSIGEAAFVYCTSLKEVTIPSSVTSIGDWAFYNCTSLTSVTIPDSVTSIGEAAFVYCTSLKEVTIPSSVTSIGDWAFYNCTSLTSVSCKPTTPPTGGFCMFDGNASGRKIYVPRNSVRAYMEASYWGDYKSYIVGYDF